MWDAQARALADELRVVRYDHRGHGASPVPPGAYAMDDLGADVVALLDHLEIERASFCGLSMGGMVGMWLGANAPERVDRLVLCCTAARMDAAVWAERIALIRRARSLEPLADATIERWLSPAFAEAHPGVAAWLRAMLVAQDHEGYASCAEAIADMTIEDTVSDVRAPTLVLAAATTRRRRRSREGRSPTPSPERGSSSSRRSTWRTSSRRTR